MRQAIEGLGDMVLHRLERLGMLTIFLFNCLLRVFFPPYKLRPIVEQIHFIGARSWFVIVFSGVFTGMVLALQGHHTLQRFASVDLLGSVVSVGLIRELGPVLTALLVIGRAGSAMCAEIGIMRSTEQIDALECMAIDPYKYLLAPKFVGAMLSLPILTSMFDVAGIFGGYLSGVVIFGVSHGAYFQGMYETTVWNDVQMGLVKSCVFGLLIVWIACAKGYLLHRERVPAFGAEGVSRVTTSAVVLSSVAILVADYAVAAVLL